MIAGTVKSLKAKHDELSKLLEAILGPATMFRVFGPPFSPPGYAALLAGANFDLIDIFCQAARSGATSEAVQAQHLLQRMSSSASALAHTQPAETTVPRNQYTQAEFDALLAQSVPFSKITASLDTLQSHVSDLKKTVSEIGLA